MLNKIFTIFFIYLLQLWLIYISQGIIYILILHQIFYTMKTKMSALRELIVIKYLYMIHKINILLSSRSDDNNLSLCAITCIYQSSLQSYLNTCIKYNTENTDSGSTPGYKYIIKILSRVVGKCLLLL